MADEEDRGVIRKSKNKKKSQKWQQGRDKIPASICPSDRNHVLRTSFKKNMPTWRKTSRQLEHVIETTTDENGFQLGCKVCMAYVAAHPDEKRHKSRNGQKLATGEFGRGGIRKHDLLRHFQGPRSNLHQDALRWQSEPVSEKKEGDTREDVPSPAQFRIAYAMLKENPKAATGKAYEKACEDARAGDEQNVPPFRCSGQVFGKIAMVVGRAVVHDLHRRLAHKNNKNPPQWACLAEDDGGGIRQKGMRVAFKDFSAVDICLDWYHHDGKKSASCEQLAGFFMEYSRKIN